MHKRLFLTCLAIACVSMGANVTAASAAEKKDKAPSKVVNENRTFGELDDSSRYLYIMGSVDGFGAGGPGSPCFPEKDNVRLDQELKQAGFANEMPTKLPTALMTLRAAPELCMDKARRSYTASLLKTMPNEHLTVYLTGLVRAYASIKECPASSHQRAAANAAAAIFSADDSAQPNDILTPALIDGCKEVVDS